MQRGTNLEFKGGTPQAGASNEGVVSSSVLYDFSTRGTGYVLGPGRSYAQSVSQPLNIRFISQESVSKTPKAEAAEVNLLEQQKFKDFCKEFKDCLDIEIIETGKKSAAEYYIERWLDVDPVLVQRGVGTVALEAGADPKRLVGVLNVITHADRALFKPVNELIVLSCLSNKSSAVKEFAIGVYEYWADPELVSSLKNHELTPQWLDDYRKQVIIDYCGE